MTSGSRRGQASKEELLALAQSFVIERGGTWASDEPEPAEESPPPAPSDPMVEFLEARLWETGRALREQFGAVGDDDPRPEAQAALRAWKELLREYESRAGAH